MAAGGVVDAPAGAADASGGVTDASGGSADASGGVADASGGSADASGGVADASGGAPDASGGAADAPAAASARPQQAPDAAFAAPGAFLWAPGLTDPVGTARGVLTTAGRGAGGRTGGWRAVWAGLVQPPAGPVQPAGWSAPPAARVTSSTSLNGAAGCPRTAAARSMNAA